MEEANLAECRVLHPEGFDGLLHAPRLALLDATANPLCGKATRAECRELQDAFTSRGCTVVLYARPRATSTPRPLTRMPRHPMPGTTRP